MPPVLPARLRRLVVLLAAAGMLAAAPAARAQDAPAQPQDEEFAKLVREWTTKPEFSSPLVDHLPLRAGVPTPKDVLGYHIGAPKKLTYTADQQRYFKALAEALPGRVKTISAGTTEEGRDILIAFISSEANMERLEQNRQNLKRLADPRGLGDAERQRLLETTKLHYHISAGLHSGETSPPEAVMELAYRLAVSDEPYIQAIRDNVIVSIAPATDLDGRDRYVDWYYAYKIDEPYEGGPNYGGPPYWGKYVFHDNNRDINYGVDSLRAHLNFYLHWVPPIWHDLHEAQTLLYTFSGQPPQNANLDPILYTELPFIATYEVNKLTGYGMPGVWHFGFVDMWSPGYLGFAAANHNGMLRMYEIFNQGGANTKKAKLEGSQTTRQWYRPNPAPEGEVDWSIRNSVNYAETGVLTALELASQHGAMFVENFYKKSMHSVLDGRDTPPHAFVIPGGQSDPTQVDRVVNLLRRQAIEVHRAPAEFEVEEGTFPAGSYIVKLDQPYGRLAKTLLEKQNYPDPALRTYDDSAWTMGLASNITIETIEDKKILDVTGELLTEDVRTRGTITRVTGPLSPKLAPDSARAEADATRASRATGAGAAGAARATGATGAGAAGAGPVYAVKHNGSLNLITLRYRLKDVAVKGAQEPFAVGGDEFPAGSFLIAGADDAAVRKEIESLGLVAAVLPAMPDVDTVDVDLPRIAIYTTWMNTEKVGWVRLAFDRWEIPFDLIHKDHVQAGADLRGKYDVIIMPHQTSSARSIVFEMPKLDRPLPYEKNDEFKSFGMYASTDDVRGGMGLAGAAEIARFVEEGGVLLTFGVASYFPPEFGLTRAVDARRPAGNWYAPGPYVQSEILKAEHPVLYGYTGTHIPMRWADGPLLTVPEPDSPQAQLMGLGSNPPTTLVRFQGTAAGVLSGHLAGADQLKERPAVVDAPVGKGRVIMYVNNPIYRWQTFGEHGLVYNALLYWNDMDGQTTKVTR